MTNARTATKRRIVTAHYEWHEECNGPVCLVCDNCSCEAGCVCPDGATYGWQAAEALDVAERRPDLPGDPVTVSREDLRVAVERLPVDGAYMQAIRDRLAAAAGVTR